MRCAIWNFWNFSTFSKPSWELLIWNFQMRLETRYAIWHFWNLKLFKSIMSGGGVAYLKLSDETWNEMCYLKLLKLLKLFNPSQELVIWNFQMRLEKEVLFETFEIWNFSNSWWGLLIWNFQMRLEMRCAIRTFKTSNFQPITGVGYLKLSDETWNEMCYLKLLKFETFQTHDGGCLFETFR